jgi:hypothetical protein
MDLRKWEPIVQQILAEMHQQPSESGKQKVLTAWRAKLEKEPTSLQAFQIDLIIREVRRHLDSASRKSA